MVTEAAAAGDLVARAAFASVGRWLGVGLANLVAAFDPALLVVGGGVADAGERLLGPAREALAGSLVGAGPPRGAAPGARRARPGGRPGRRGRARRRPRRG